MRETRTLRASECGTKAAKGGEMRRTETSWAITRWLLKWLVVVFVVAVVFIFVDALINDPEEDPKDGSVIKLLTD